MNKKRIATLLYSYFVLLYLEFTLRAFTVGAFDKRVVFTAAFCLPIAAFLSVFTLISNKAVFKWIYCALIAVFSIYFCVQLVYYEIFKGYLSFALLGMGGDAVTNFMTQMITAIKNSALGILCLILPIISSAILCILDKLSFTKAGVKISLVSVASIFVLHLLCLASLYLGGTGQFSVYDVYHSGQATTDVSAKNFGMFTTTRLEAQRLVLSKLGFITPNDGLDVNIDISEQDTDTDKDVPVTGEYYNILDLDAEKLKALCSDDKTAENVLQNLLNRAPTKKNEYTGFFEGKNLITICAEAFSPYVISEELTPTLYKLSNEGFIFNNYYGSYESVTTDGEYAFCFGMFPDATRWGGNASFTTTADKAEPFALGNMFLSAGAKTFAYHNYNGTYYKRNETHPNMGYDVFKTPDAGLDIEIGWPSSDVDMMVESVDDYIGLKEQFHVYYMTFSGHYQYDWENPIAKKNRDKVEHLSYSDSVKAYIACNLELEYALQYLMERLDEAGILEDTVIVMTNDHYPYGLTIEQYSELAGKEIDEDFEKYKNSFICWSGSMEKPVTVDKLCSTVDILPTVLNLFGLEYDSRFIIGHDVLSDHEGVAIIANKNYITDDYKFNAVDNEVTMLSDRDIPREDIDRKAHYISGIIGLSKSMLYTDIYKYIVNYYDTYGQ